MMIIEQVVYEDVERNTNEKYKGIFKEDGWVNAEQPEYLVSDDNVISMILDLVYEVEHWKEKYEDLKNDIDSNYKRMTVEEQVGISDRDFIC